MRPGARRRPGRDWRTWGGALCLLGLSVPAYGVPDSGARLINDAAVSLVRALRSDGAGLAFDSSRSTQLTEDLVLPLVDYPRVGRRLAGPRWRQATPGQRQRLQQSIRTYLLYTVSDALRRYPSQVADIAASLRLVRERPASDGRQTTVVTRLTLPSGADVDVGFRLCRARPSLPWRIADLTVEGFSLVSAQALRLLPYGAAGGLDGLSHRMMNAAGAPARETPH